MALTIKSANQLRKNGLLWGKINVRIILAAVLCLASGTPLFADTLILRCDAKDQISFSVSIDPITHSVHSMGFASKVETDQFSDTVIAARSKDTSPPESLVIDRITGQFLLSSSPANPNNTNTTDKSASYQGICGPAHRLF